MKKALEPFEKIRKAVGDKIEIMVEFHSLWNLPTAIKIARALEPYEPTWYEDPIRMNSPQALAEFARSTDGARSAPARRSARASPTRTCSTATPCTSSWSICAGPAA